MNAVVSGRCLTRVMTDDDHGVEVAQLQSVMHRIQSSLFNVPAAQREYIANALLNLAVTRMVKEEGKTLTASILMRLGDVVASSDRQAAAGQAALARPSAPLHSGSCPSDARMPGAQGCAGPAPETAVDLTRING